MTTKGSNNPFPSILLNEVATDGSDTPTPVADYRRLFLGEDGELHLIDSADVVTDVSGAAGSVATDAIWDADGDLAVGSGANTAAKLAKGAEGSALSVMDGVVGWNAATSMPGSPTTNQRVYRTDLQIEFTFDGTQWLCTCPHELALTTRVEQTSLGYSATNTVANAATRGTASAIDDIWVDDFIVAAFARAANWDGSNFWVITLDKLTAANAATTIGTLTFNSATANNWVHGIDAVDEVVAGSAHVAFRIVATRTGSPGDLILGAHVTYRLIGV